MSVTGVTVLGIGELARLTGVPVRTIRFYCDEGILEAGRTYGGHRRFGPDAVERLRTVRRLRALGLGLPEIGRVLAGERSLAEAVAAERAALDAELADLAWRRASLRAVEEADPVERARRLDLLAAAERGGAARDALVAFWRGLVVAQVPPGLMEAFLHGTVPDPPPDPTPAQVVAYAEMVALAADRSLARTLWAGVRRAAAEIADEGALMLGAHEASAMVRPAVAAGRPPAPGPALDLFVEAHATARDTRDTPGFRRRLLRTVRAGQDERMDRYWRLHGEVTGDPVTLGAAQSWLVAALATTCPPPAQ